MWRNTFGHMWRDVLCRPQTKYGYPLRNVPEEQMYHWLRSLMVFGVDSCAEGLHWCVVVACAQVGASRAMPAGGRVAGTANHYVVEVLVAGVSPLRSGTGSAGMCGSNELGWTLDRLGQHQVRARLRATHRFLAGSPCNNRRHVIEQAGKEAHCATSPGLPYIPNVPVKINRGNGGTVGATNVSRVSRRGICSPPFFRGNSDNQRPGTEQALIFKNMFVFPLFPIHLIGGTATGHGITSCSPIPPVPHKTRFL